MRRLLRRTALAAAFLLLVAAAAGWLAAATEAGLRWSVGLAQRLAGGTLTVGAVHGRLLDAFVLERLRYAGRDGTVVEARRLVLRIRLDELPQHRLHIEMARAEELRVRIPPPTVPATGSVRLPTALPLDLLVDALGVDGLKIVQGVRGGADETVIASDRAALAGRWIGDRIEIARLDLALPDTGPLTATARGRMRTDRIEVAALKIVGPGEVRASGTYGVGATPSDLQLQWKSLQWPLTAAHPRLAGFVGQGRVQGSLQAYRFELATAAQVNRLALTLDAHGAGDLGGLRFEHLGLAAGKGSLRAQGSLAWRGAFAADLKGRFSGLDPGLLAPEWSGALNGSLDAQTRQRGEGVETAFTLALDRSTLRGQPLALTARGSTDFRQLRLDALRLQSGRGTVSASGTVAWSPQLRIDAQARIQALDPAQFLPRWNGNLNGSVQASTQTRGGEAEIAFAAQFDRSQLRGYPLKLDTHGLLRGLHSLSLQDFSLACGDTLLTLAGQATPPFALRGRLASTNLVALHPDLGGRGSLDFTLDGPLDTPHLVAKGDFHGLHFRRYRVATLDIDADIDPSRPSRLSLTAGESWAGLAIHGATVRIGGNQAYQHADIHVASERGDAAVAFDGGYDPARREWGGQLSGLAVAPSGLPPWALEKPAGLLLGAQRQSLEPACLSGGSGRVCLRLEENVTREGLRLSWTLDRLLLASLAPLLPPHYTVQGQAAGSGSIEIAHGDIAAIDARLGLQDARVQVGTAPPLEVLPSSITASQDNGRLHLLADLRMPQGTITADLAAAPAADFESRALSGELRMDIPDLAFVTTLEPELQKVGGKLGGTLQFGGRIGLPRLNGEIALEDGHARLVTPSIDIDHARLRLSGNGDGPLLLSGSMQSGGGTLAVDGTVDPSVAPPNADLRLHGDAFQAMATPDAHIWVTPDLHLVAAAGVIHVDGTVAVPKAQITPHGFADKGVGVSPDQVIAGAEPAPQGKPLQIFSTVEMRLGDAVDFDGFGLSARMTGAVTLVDQPQRLTVAQGELRVASGRYQAYGQDLRIDTGRLIFDGGPVTTPAVDIYATRHPQSDVTIGVRVRGTLDKPQLNLDSDPPMAREQQLSWLVLGRALDQTSTSDRSMVSQAALSLGLSGSDYFVQKIGKGIGLDQVSVGAAPAGGSDVTANASAIAGSQAAQTGPTGPATRAAQLTLGKYLTPRLFVSYGVSLFQPGQTFRLLYDLGHGFKLQTESGTASGGDILYTVERGH